MKKYCKSYHLILLVFFLVLSVMIPSQPAYAKKKLNKTTMVLQKGKSKKLKVSGGGKVKWSSSNKKIAKVSSTGKVTGVKGGNAVIKAKVGSKTLKCKVKVFGLNYAYYTLKTVGSTKTLKVTNGKNTSWKSSNPKVVTVNNGKIKAVASGTAKITCKTRGVKLICKVYVPNVNVTTKRLEVGESFNFMVSNTRNKATYSCSDSTVLSVNTKTGACRALSHGSAYVFGKADGYTYYCYVIVTKQGDIVTPLSMISSNTKGETYRQDVNTAKGYRTFTVFHQTSTNGFKTNTITQEVIDYTTPTTEASTETQPTTETGSTTEPTDPTNPTNPENPTDPVNPVDPVVPEPVIKTYTYNVKNYISNHGCAACATTCVLSGYTNEPQTPVNTVQNLEFGALGFKNWDKNYSKKEDDQMPIALYGIQQVLEKNGIPNQYIRTYSRPDVLTHIRDHLLKGKQVVIAVGATRYDGIKDKRWTGGRHTMVLLGMTDNYKVIVADSADRASTFGNMRRIKIVDLTDVCGYMFRTTKTSGSNLTYPYYTNYQYCGGYILVDTE